VSTNLAIFAQRPTVTDLIGAPLAVIGAIRRHRLRVSHELTRA
jgi:hypothetical protein